MFVWYGFSDNKFLSSSTSTETGHTIKQLHITLLNGLNAIQWGDEFTGTENGGPKMNRD